MIPRRERFWKVLGSCFLAQGTECLHRIKLKNQGPFFYEKTGVENALERKSALSRVATIKCWQFSFLPATDMFKFVCCFYHIDSSTIRLNHLQTSWLSCGRWRCQVRRLPSQWPLFQTMFQHLDGENPLLCLMKCLDIFQPCLWQLNGTLLMGTFGTKPGIFLREFRIFSSCLWQQNKIFMTRCQDIF